MAQLLVKHIKIDRVRAVQRSLQGRLNNQQLSSTTAPQGTTSPISKPGTSALSMISEYGGVTTSTQNQTATFQISPYVVPSSLATAGWVPYCNQSLAISRDCISGGVLQWLNRASVSITANTNTSSTSLAATPASGGTSTASAQQVTATSSGSRAPSFAGASGKYVLLYSKGKKADFSNVDYSGATAAIDTLVRDLKVNPLFHQWQSCVRADLDALWVDPNTPVKTLKPAEQAEAVIKLALVDYEEIEAIARTGEQMNSCKVPAALVSIRDSYKDAVQQANAKFMGDLPTAIAALDANQAKIDDDIIKTMTTPALSFEYDFSTPVNQPSNSTAKLVYSYILTGKQPPANAAGGNAPSTASCPASQTAAPAGGNAAPAAKQSSTVACPLLTATLNGGLSWYSTTPSSSIPGAGQLRDVQLGIELDKNIASSKWGWVGSLIGDTTLSATYYYQDQTSPSILKVTPGSPLSGITLADLPSTATQLFTQKGNINFVQLKYGFGTGTNVKFPIAVSWSNHSDLIQHPTWGAQFGISYDFTTLLGSGGGGSNSASGSGK